MATLIDASVLIAAERGDLAWDDLVADHADVDIALAAITASELLHGVHRATAARIRARRESFVERVLARVPVIPLDLVAARVHARVWADLAANRPGPGHLVSAAARRRRRITARSPR